MNCIRTSGDRKVSFCRPLALSAYYSCKLRASFPKIGDRFRKFFSYAPIPQAAFSPPENPPAPGNHCPAPLPARLSAWGRPPLHFIFKFTKTEGIHLPDAVHYRRFSAEKVSHFSLQCKLFYYISTNLFDCRRKTSGFSAYLHKMRLLHM